MRFEILFTQEFIDNSKFIDEVFALDIEIATRGNIDLDYEIDIKFEI